jgi:hypothetical protein
MASKIDTRSVMFCIRRAACTRMSGSAARSLRMQSSMLLSRRCAAAPKAGMDSSELLEKTGW